MTGGYISRFQDAARKVADGNFETQIPIASAGQLGQLARTFNEMQRRLAELDSARKQFIANASHELRTPIFSLGGFVELLEEEDPSPRGARRVRAHDAPADRPADQADRRPARPLPARRGGDGDAAPQRRPRLAWPARSPASSALAPTDAARASSFARPTVRPIARADPDRVRQIIRILLDNALTHTPEGTKVTVTTYSVKTAAQS